MFIDPSWQPAALLQTSGALYGLFIVAYIYGMQALYKRLPELVQQQNFITSRARTDPPDVIEAATKRVNESVDAIRVNTNKARKNFKVLSIVTLAALFTNAAALASIATSPIPEDGTKATTTVLIFYNPTAFVFWASGFVFFLIQGGYQVQLAISFAKWAVGETPA